MTTARTPKTPPGLAVAGRKLWASVTDEYDLEEHELALLLQAARCADTLDRLAVEAAANPVTITNYKGDQISHPALTEGRAQAVVLSRLIASLRLPSGEEFGDAHPQRRGASRGSYGLRGAA